MPKEMPMDMLNNSTREVVFRRKNKELFKKLAQESRFDEREVEALGLIHRKIEKVRGPLNRTVFRDIFHSGLDYTENIRHLLVDRVFSQFDKRNALQISPEQWITSLSTVLRDPVQVQTEFAYKIYDLMKTNKLTKEQIFPMLRGCFIKVQPEEDPDETVKDMIELLVKAIDIDRDGDVSEEEFRKAVLEKNSLFLECMGPVFPSREAKHAFLTTFTNRVARF
ncbi:EF-hand calcium-binding domain-containing protein 1 isoform X1 [Nasonia vitripennis]|uniref:EF-hand domain-containing protein n=1 Tax=Nasonia vitripennis TaxID=7425 RepID=A0A7M7IXC3_NASVI|nr:EF-hand calcium-binding domain-containing protein 1 isoform X1 [Nasonia vitripennis]XP_016840182.1 EF-hand calcium-binding domain-containing protein 1 isoform X1 [Nasonia vitripennis]XP_016840183.1 EF-hand calcium-binding domain-containing protein 1 isoform X1 [Nasonia vitripennis]XP_016840185.1 EF-hand calcium-binding domain-containing protein 1 isoform X1 [Nasonia vitripennis]XP_016840186.1 EF-hand calcium-binding domain-containing protein 1 isoform X1 [Nasonia vitripennis]XP_016840187.1 